MRLPLTFATGLLTGVSILTLAGAYQGEAPAQPRPLVGLDEPRPPVDQTYAGTLKCAACHFDQYQNWRTTQPKHARAFDILPVAYRDDPTCLKCHTTGYGHPTGFRTSEDRQLAGITCESCHGPGSAHIELARKFVTKKSMTDEQKKIATDSIYRMVPENACLACHMTRAHGKHPEYQK